MARGRIKNIGASVRARLLYLAKAERRNFNTVLLRYFQERFLYRLSVSPYRDHFILKGALLFLTFDAPHFRPTKDIDLLGRSTSNDLEHIRTIIEQIAQVSAKACAEERGDGVVFTPGSTTVKKIKELEEYSGVRVKIEAQLANARQTLQIDIGFGDLVIAGPVEVDFPVLLDQPTPRIKGYSKESAIAEKFEAIVRFNFLTSRMKDFFDILFLAKNESFRMRLLRTAIDATFHRRMTELSDRAVIFTEEFKTQPSKQEQWTAFLHRNHLHNEDISQFDKVIELIQAFLEPVCCKTVDALEDLIWTPNLLSWQ